MQASSQRAIGGWAATAAGCSTCAACCTASGGASSAGRWSPHKGAHARHAAEREPALGTRHPPTCPTPEALQPSELGGLDEGRARPARASHVVAGLVLAHAGAHGRQARQQRELAAGGSGGGDARRPACGSARRVEDKPPINHRPSCPVCAQQVCAGPAAAGGSLAWPPSSSVAREGATRTLFIVALAILWSRSLAATAVREPAELSSRSSTLHRQVWKRCRPRRRP